MTWIPSKVERHYVTIEAAAFYQADARGTMRTPPPRTVAVQARCTCGWESGVGAEPIIVAAAREHEGTALIEATP